MLWFIIILQKEWNNDPLGTLIRGLVSLVCHDISSKIFLNLTKGGIGSCWLLYTHYHFMDCQQMTVWGICIVYLSLILETEILSFFIFSSNSYRKRWKYYITNRLSLELQLSKLYNNKYMNTNNKLWNFHIHSCFSF